MQGSAGIEQKLNDIQARLMADTDLRTRGENNAPTSPSLGVSSNSNSFASGSGSYPKRPQYLLVNSPSRPRRTCDYLPPNIMQQPKQVDSSEIDSKMNEIMRMNGMLHINNKPYQTEMKDLEHLGELGSGTCGQVVKMLHTPSQTVMAVKQMRRSGNGEENKRIIMDLDVVLKSYDCPTIVRCLGCFITESEVWICMELMATCFDRLLKRLHVSVPEPICGKITLSTVRALHYLKEKHGVIHRDVKPSNILLDEKGNIKLCDFGISGRLVDSKARTKNAGCAAYMAPERIEPPDPRRPDYDIRADVWSLGITLVEMATGEFPYKDCKSDFEVLSRVLKDEPPSLLNYPMRFSADFTNFVSLCLTKNYEKRPKYRKLLAHPFLQRYANTFVDVAEWYKKVVESCGMSSPALAVRNVNNVNGRINNPSLVSPFSRRRLTPERDKMNPSIRSTSLSPNRYHRASDSPRKCSNEESHMSAKKIISSVVKQLVSGGSAPPSPPPRNSRNSPRFLKRSTELNQSSQNSPIHVNPFVQQHPSSNSQPFASLSRGTNPFAPSYTTHQHQLHTTGFLSQSSQVSYPAYNGSPSTVRRNLEASPCLSRRYISPSPPIPPPRRVSECNSVPGSPLTIRVKHSFTPEPTRRTLNLDL